MSYLLDTCVISEVVRRHPSEPVLTWLSSQDELSICLSVITLGEIQDGVSLLEPGPRKQELQAWLDRDLPARFAGRVLNITPSVARHWGALDAGGRQRGQPLPVLDGLIAASAASAGLTLVTRNVPHFQEPECPSSIPGAADWHGAARAPRNNSATR